MGRNVQRSTLVSGNSARSVKIIYMSLGVLFRKCLAWVCMFPQGFPQHAYLGSGMEGVGSCCGLWRGNHAHWKLIYIRDIIGEIIAPLALNYLALWVQAACFLQRRRLRLKESSWLSRDLKSWINGNVKTWLVVVHDSNEISKMKVYDIKTHLRSWIAMSGHGSSS